MMNKIPVIRASMPPMEEYVNEIESIWDSCWLTNHGIKVEELEEQVAKTLGVEYAISCVNGHQALELALKVLNLKGEVITTPFTFVSTTAAIVRCGLTPVFCDIREDDYTLDPDKVEELITDKTCAILAVHVYGNICQDYKLRQIADRHGLKLIYDAAHAFGVEYNGRGCGALGDISMFSMHATKVFNSIEGGLITFHNQELWDKLWSMQNFGIIGREQVEYVGTNAKMNEFQAAMGLCNLRHMKEYVESRKRAYERYIDRLTGMVGIKLNLYSADIISNYAYFPVVINPEKTGFDRNWLAEYLSAYGIGSRKYFSPLTSSYVCYRQYDKNPTPIAKRISAQVLTLPLYAGLTVKEVDWICDRIQECL